MFGQEKMNEEQQRKKISMWEASVSRCLWHRCSWSREQTESRHESICLVNEWKEKKKVVSLVQMCLLCTHNQTHAVDLVWKNLIKTLTIKIIDPDSSWPSLWFWEKRRRKKERKQTSKTRSSHQNAAAAALITKGILYCCCLFYIVEKTSFSRTKDKNKRKEKKKEKRKEKQSSRVSNSLSWSR